MIALFEAIGDFFGEEAALKFAKKIDYLLDHDPKILNAMVFLSMTKLSVPLALAQMSWFRSLRYLNQTHRINVNNQFEFKMKLEGVFGIGRIHVFSWLAVYLLPAKDELDAFFTMKFLDEQIYDGLDADRSYRVFDQVRSVVSQVFHGTILANMPYSNLYNEKARQRNIYDWLVKHGAEESRVSDIFRDVGVARAFETRRGDWLNRIYPTENARQTRVALWFKSSDASLNGSEWFMAASSLAYDANLNATIEWIRDLVERADDEVFYDQEEFLMEVNLEQINATLDGRGLSAAKKADISEKLKELFVYLSSPEFGEFLNSEYGVRKGDPFAENLHPETVACDVTLYEQPPKTGSIH